MQDLQLSSCGKPKWTPYDFCGNTHAMMAGAKPIAAITGSDDEEEVENGNEEKKGTSDDEPENETLAKLKRIPRRSLFMEEMAMPLPKPHTTPEKMTMMPDMNSDHLESCLTKTQDLIQDTINDLFSTTEKLTTMKNSIQVTDRNELENKPPRSVLELATSFLRCDSMRHWHIKWNC